MSLDPRIATTLDQLRGGLVTAREIAAASGISKRQVYRRIETLRARGHRIVGQRGAGYLLRPAPREDVTHG